MIQTEEWNLMLTRTLISCINFNINYYYYSFIEVSDNRNKANYRPELEGRLQVTEKEMSTHTKAKPKKLMQ